MKSLKHVLLKNHEGVAQGARVPWSDTWVECFIGKRKKLFLGPTYMSLSDFEASREIERQYADEEQDGNYESGARLVEALIAYGTPWRSFSFTSKDSPGTPFVVVNARYLDKQKIEQATSEMLMDLHHIPRGASCSFRWKNYHHRLRICPYSPSNWGDDP